MLITLARDHKLERTLEKFKKIKPTTTKKAPKEIQLGKLFQLRGREHPEQMLQQKEEGRSREAESSSVWEWCVGQVKEATLQARPWVLSRSSSVSGAACKVSPGQLKKDQDCTH